MDLEWHSIVEQLSELETEEAVFQLLLSSLKRYGAGLYPVW
jgi:hypothetical protein